MSSSADPFEPYIERRKRCEAFRFMGVQDVEATLQALHVSDDDDWQLERNRLVITFKPRSALKGASVQVVNLGDYLVRNRGFANMEPAVVTGSQEFHKEWERDG